MRGCVKRCPCAPSGWTWCCRMRPIPPHPTPPHPLYRHHDQNVGTLLPSTITTSTPTPVLASPRACASCTPVHHSTTELPSAVNPQPTARSPQPSEVHGCKINTPTATPVEAFYVCALNAHTCHAHARLLQEKNLFLSPEGRVDLVLCLKTGFQI